MNRPRCRVGDRALIVQSTVLQNLGRVVRVQRRADSHDTEHEKDYVLREVVWNVVSEGSPLLVECYDGARYFGMEALHHDATLIPLRGQSDAKASTRRKRNPIKVDET